MLKLIETPVAVDPPSPALAAVEPRAVPEQLSGDSDLAAMLNAIRTLLGIDAIAAHLLTASGDLGTLLAAAGPVPSTKGWQECPFEQLARATTGVWLPQPQGEAATHVSLVEPRARDRIAILCRPGGDDAGARRHFERQVVLFLPLIERTIGQWTRAHVRELRLREQTAVLDTLGSALLVIDDDCRIRLINAAARAQVADSGVLCTANDRLVIRNLQDAMQFQVSLQHVLSSPDDRRDTIIAAVRRSDAPPVLLAISAIPRRGAAAPLATVQIIDPEAELCLPLETLARHYDLTQAEGRLIEQLVRGRTLAEAATALRLKEQTARTYLKHIFQKTGLRRQVQLIRLILAGAVPSPCAG